MRKYVDPIPLGGAPLHNQRITNEFQNDIWAAIEGIVSHYATTSQGVIIKGCEVTGAGPYNISEGVVFIDGEFKRLPAQNGVTLPKYIQSAATTYEQKEFADKVFKNLIIVKDAELADVIPGAGQYIEVTPTNGIQNRLFNRTEWIDIPLVNGWVQATDSPINPTAQYMVDYDRGMVHLRGTVNAAASTSAVFCTTADIPVPAYDGSNTYVVMRRDNADMAVVSLREIGGSTRMSILTAYYNTADQYPLWGISYFYRDKYPMP